MNVRRMLVTMVVLLLAVQVVRNSAVWEFYRLHPEISARFWITHPAVETSLGLAEIGRSSRARSSVAQSTFALIDHAAEGSPLSPEPFLVHGIAAELAGDSKKAEQNFLAAQARDPRSMAAAYFLAQYYLQSGQALAGLQQTALAARLSPNGVSAVAPYVALYARKPENWPQIRSLFKSDPAIVEPALEAIATNSDGVGALLFLADSEHRKPDSRWLPILLQSMIADGQHARAREVWAAIATPGRAPRDLLYDSTFSSPEAPPPFNWKLTASPLGLAERDAHKLHVIFYGEQDGVLASQLLLLPPGSYRFSLTRSRDGLHPELLRWSMRCDKSPNTLASATLEQAARGWSFAIPADCRAQWLELSGQSGDVAQQADVTIGPVTLVLEKDGA
jgi:hypothetical protein